MQMHTADPRDLRDPHNRPTDPLSQQLLRTRCTAGWLIITIDAIRIERKSILSAGGRSEVLPRHALVGVKLDSKFISVFGFGGGTTLTFTGNGGMVIQAKMVNATDARRIMALLGFA